MPIPEEGPFLELEAALKELDETGRYGVRSGEIEAIEAYWYLQEDATTSAAYVLRLIDGRRTLLQWLVNCDSDAIEIALTTDTLGAGEAPPPPYPGALANVWSRDVDEMNAWLRKAKSS